MMLATCAIAGNEKLDVYMEALCSVMDGEDPEGWTTVKAVGNVDADFAAVGVVYLLRRVSDGVHIIVISYPEPSGISASCILDLSADRDGILAGISGFADAVEEAVFSAVVKAFFMELA
jgi:hypothetical protein